jgi:hypothetical protein
VFVSLTITATHATAGTVNEGAAVHTAQTAIAPCERAFSQLHRLAVAAGMEQRRGGGGGGDPASVYKLAQLLGQGAFAQVWKAVHRDTGASVAVKIYRPAKCKTPAFRKMVDTEIRSATWRVGGCDGALLSVVVVWWCGGVAVCVVRVVACA